MCPTIGPTTGKSLTLLTTALAQGASPCNTSGAGVCVCVCKLKPLLYISQAESFQGTPAGGHGVQSGTMSLRLSVSDMVRGQAQNLSMCT